MPQNTKPLSPARTARVPARAALVLAAVALASLASACEEKGVKPDLTVDKEHKEPAKDPAQAETIAATADPLPTGALGLVTVGEQQLPVTVANAGEVLRKLIDTPHSTQGELGLVFFSLDSDSVSDESKKWLADVALALKANPALTVRLGGHADERGSDTYNDALSLRRARAVASFLSERGVAAAQLEPAAYGVRRPLDPGHDAGAWARNRRCELKLPEAAVTAALGR
jgi:peptidoglycan-associated lipoprotein